MTATTYGPDPRAARSVVRTATGLVLAVLALVGMARLADLLPSLTNPFASTTVDRTAPAVLHALEDVSRYTAASATYSVVVDIEEDARWMPSFIKGERAVLTAQGSVDASVELGGLDADSILVTDGGRAVVITLPAAALSQPRLDLEATHVVARDRGLLDRLGSVFADNPSSERQLYARAEAQMSTASRADDSLLRRARTNTRLMLERLLAPLGFETVEVRFTPSG